MACEPAVSTLFRKIEPARFASPQQAENWQLKTLPFILDSLRCEKPKGCEPYPANGSHLKAGKH